MSLFLAVFQSDYLLLSYKYSCRSSCTMTDSGNIQVLYIHVCDVSSWVFRLEDFKLMSNNALRLSWLYIVMQGICIWLAYCYIRSYKLTV